MMRAWAVFMVFVCLVQLEVSAIEDTEVTSLNVASEVGDVERSTPPTEEISELGSTVRAQEEEEVVVGRRAAFLYGGSDPWTFGGSTSAGMGNRAGNDEEEEEEEEEEMLGESGESDGQRRSGRRILGTVKKEKKLLKKAKTAVLQEVQLLKTANKMVKRAAKKKAVRKPKRSGPQCRKRNSCPGGNGKLAVLKVPLRYQITAKNLARKNHDVRNIHNMNLGRHNMNRGNLNRNRGNLNRNRGNLNRNRGNLARFGKNAAIGSKARFGKNAAIGSKARFGKNGFSHGKAAIGKAAIGKMAGKKMAGMGHHEEDEEDELGASAGRRAAQQSARAICNHGKICVDGVGIQECATHCCPDLRKGAKMKEQTTANKETLEDLKSLRKQGKMKLKDGCEGGADNPMCYKCKT